VLRDNLNKQHNAARFSEMSQPLLSQIDLEKGDLDGDTIVLSDDRDINSLQKPLKVRKRRCRVCRLLGEITFFLVLVMVTIAWIDLIERAHLSHTQSEKGIFQVMP
jgi:hypothetical protein